MQIILEDSLRASKILTVRTGTHRETAAAKKLINGVITEVLEVF